MRIFKKKAIPATAEDAAFADRLSAIAGRGKVDYCPAGIVPEPLITSQIIPQLFGAPTGLLAESARE